MRHTALLEALGISAFGVGAGYTYIESGELPDGLVADELMYTQ